MRKGREGRGRNELRIGKGREGKDVKGWEGGGRVRERKGKGEGRCGRGRKGNESGGRARLGYLSRCPEYLAMPLRTTLTSRYSTHSERPHRCHLIAD